MKAWTLDHAGHRGTFASAGTTETRTHDAKNRLTAIGATTLTYDSNGNLTANGRTTYPYDGIP